MKTKLNFVNMFMSIAGHCSCFGWHSDSGQVPQALNSQYLCTQVNQVSCLMFLMARAGPEV